jgi:hypothetical protein
VTIDAEAIAQIDGLLAEIEPHIQAQGGSMGGAKARYVAPEPNRAAMKARAAAAIERLAPPGSRYVTEAANERVAGLVPAYAVVALAGILGALRADYKAGYLRSIEGLIHADLFADFLEMSEELLRNKYKDAAAVIAGSVLEEHLRKLAGQHGIAVERNGRPLKAATVNDHLAAGSVYNKLAQKSVTAWLDLRNNAAHGHYGEYDGPQVEGMIRDVRGFMERNPA